MLLYEPIYTSIGYVLHGHFGKSVAIFLSQVPQVATNMLQLDAATNVCACGSPQNPLNTYSI